MKRKKNGDFKSPLFNHCENLTASIFTFRKCRLGVIGLNRQSK